MTDFQQLRDELLRQDDFRSRADLLERELIKSSVERANDVERWRTANDNMSPPLDMLLSPTYQYEALVTALLIPTLPAESEPKLFVFNDNRKEGTVNALDWAAA